MYKHVLWDFDGTLFDTYPAMAEAMAFALNKRGLPHDYDEIYALMKQSVDIATTHFRKLYAIDDAFMADYSSRRREIEADMSSPYPGIPELLRDIVETGGHNYICTHRGATIYPMLDRYGLTRFFRDIVTTERGFARKPDPESVLYVLNAYDIRRSDAIMIGDRELDILAGQRAGIAACDYWDGSGGRVDCADYIACDAAGLRKLIIGRIA